MKILGIAIIAAVLFVSGCTASGLDYTEFATCLNENGISEYGSYSCSVCQRVEVTLGEAHDIVDFVECSPSCNPDENGVIPSFCDGHPSQNQECLDRGVTHTPSWVQNGEIIHVGGDLNALAEASGCALPTPEDANG